MLDFFIKRKDKVLNFFIIGVILTILNLSLIYFFIEVLLFNTTFLENIANIIAIEIGIILSFFLNRKFTWKSSKNNDYIFTQLIKFHSVVGLTAVLRIVCFILFQYIGVKYFFNTLICIIISAIFNFVLYDLKVFNEKN